MDNKRDILNILESIQKGETTPEDALLQLKLTPFEDLGFAKIDYHRSIRQGTPEVIFGQNKTPEQIEIIVNTMVKKGVHNILITRLAEEAAAYLDKKIQWQYHAIARMGIANPGPTAALGNIVVASGGTSDMPIAEEAALTAEALGNHVVRMYDVGVAGLHRLLANLPVFMQARAIICVAGMEGALASVVGGLVDCPVIAVPTSIGYGASFGGVSALLSMLNSCASGVSVVNIDNGFGAGFLASRINQMEGLQ